MGLTIEEIKKNQKADWEAYIEQKDEATFVDSWEWREIVEKVYGLPHYWYVARNNGKVEGLLALTLTRHLLFGSYLVSAPFGNQGGIYSDSPIVFRALIKKAEELRKEVKARYINIRLLENGAKMPDGWHHDGVYATYWMPLLPKAEFLLREHFRAKTRRDISKAAKSNLRINFGGIEILDDFWHVISRSMKELGSPYHSPTYLETLLTVMGNKAELGVVYTKDGEPVGVCLIVLHKETGTLLHANTLRRHRAANPGDFLYWSAISRCCERGMNRFDMGRSLIGSGNEAYKLKWQADKRMLAYWYNLSPGMPLPFLNQSNPRFQLAIKTWQRLPLWVHRVAGPWLITGIL